MTWYVANPVSIEVFTEYWDNFDDDQIDEAFSKILSIYLNSCKCSSIDKAHFLGDFILKFEGDVEVLEAQIQSHNFQDQSQSFEIFFPAKIKGGIVALVSHDGRIFWF